MRSLMTFVLVLVATAASSSVKAVTCYTLLDRSDRVIYQNSVPPVDMSDPGAGASRDGLRRRNEYLLVSDYSTCPPVAGVPGTTGYHAATVDEIVAEMRSYLSPGGGGGIVDTGGGGSVGAPSAAPRAAPRMSSPARSGY